VKDRRTDSYFYLAKSQHAVKSIHSVPLEMDHGTPTIQVRIQRVLRTIIIDSGSCCSILQPGTTDSSLHNTDRGPFGVTGDLLEVMGEQNITFFLDNVQYHHTFIVCELPTNASGILGIDFLKARKAKIDFETCTLNLNTENCNNMVSTLKQDSSDREYTKRESDGMRNRNTRTPYPYQENLVLPISFTRKQLDFKPSQKVDNEETIAVTKPQISLTESDAWLVQCKETVKLQPRSKQVVYGKLIRDKPSALPTLVCVEPTQIPVEGVCAARVISKVHMGKRDKQR
jgi:hypothetical protein